MSAFTVFLLHSVSECSMLSVYICATTDIVTYWTMCGRLGTNLAVYCGLEIQEIRRLAGNTSADTWRHTLGMPTIPDDATAASWLLSEVGDRQHSWCQNVQVQAIMSLVIHWVTRSAITSD